MFHYICLKVEDDKFVHILLNRRIFIEWCHQLFHHYENIKRGGDGIYEYEYSTGVVYPSGNANSDGKIYPGGNYMINGAAITMVPGSRNDYQWAAPKIIRSEIGEIGDFGEIKVQRPYRHVRVKLALHDEDFTGVKDALNAANMWEETVWSDRLDHFAKVKRAERLAMLPFPNVPYFSTDHDSSSLQIQYCIVCSEMIGKGPLDEQGASVTRCDHIYHNQCFASRMKQHKGADGVVRCPQEGCGTELFYDQSADQSTPQNSTTRSVCLKTAQDQYYYFSSTKPFPIWWCLSLGNHYFHHSSLYQAVYNSNLGHGIIARFQIDDEVEIDVAKNWVDRRIYRQSSEHINIPRSRCFAIPFTVAGGSEYEFLVWNSNTYEGGFTSSDIEYRTGLSILPHPEDLKDPVRGAQFYDELLKDNYNQCILCETFCEESRHDKKLGCGHYVHGACIDDIVSNRMGTDGAVRCCFCRKEILYDPVKDQSNPDNPPPSDNWWSDGWDMGS